MATSSKSLLQKAKSYKGRKSTVNKQEKELLIAFLNDEVNLTQVSHALNKKAGSGSVYITLMKTVKEMWDNKEIQFKK